MRINRILTNNKQLIYEFLRCVIAGGIAFSVDFTVLYLSKTMLFPDMGENGIFLAVALGFVSGLTVNYILSFLFVFKQIDEKARQHKIRAYILTSAVALIGLIITELLMYAGMNLFGEEYYLGIKILSAGVVFLWTYIGRKVWIFKGVHYER
jgi:putative flippase GtrA